MTFSFQSHFSTPLYFWKRFKTNSWLPRRPRMCDIESSSILCTDKHLENNFFLKKRILGGTAKDVPKCCLIPVMRTGTIAELT